MRNLKRALSLVMAAAMLIGMMVVSASAADNYEDFTDKDEIQNTEAVATMVSLGVINGKEDGSYFDPTGIVTRAEMAKLIAVSLNGGKDPVLGSGACHHPVQRHQGQLGRGLHRLLRQPGHHQWPRRRHLRAQRACHRHRCRQDDADRSGLPQRH